MVLSWVYLRVFDKFGFTMEGDERIFPQQTTPSLSVKGGFVGPPGYLIRCYVALGVLAYTFYPPCKEVGRLATVPDVVFVCMLTVPWSSSALMLSF